MASQAVTPEWRAIGGQCRKRENPGFIFRGIQGETAFLDPSLSEEMQKNTKKGAWELGLIICDVEVLS